MHAALRFGLQTLASGLPLRWLHRQAQVPLLLPFYHCVQDRPAPHLTGLYHVRTLKQFESELDQFLLLAPPIGPDELETSLAQGKKATLLTFDDGFACCYHDLAPLLLRKGVPAVFFLNTDFLDNQGLLFRALIGLCLHTLHTASSLQVQHYTQALLGKPSDKPSLVSFLKGIKFENQDFINKIIDVFEIDLPSFLKHEQPYLSSQEVRALQSQGFFIGSHSLNHPHFADLSPSQRVEQYEQSCQFLEQNFQMPQRLFAFPFGDFGVPAQFLDYLHSSGRCAWSFGVAGFKQEAGPFPRHLHRLAMESLPFHSKSRLKTELLSAYLKRALHKHHVHRPWA